MPQKQLAENGTAVVDAAPARPGGSTIRRVAVAVFVLAMLAIYLLDAAPTIASAVSNLAAASPTWTLVGLSATVLSMVAFAALRSYTLAAGGASVPLQQTLAVSYGAGAVHTTLPAGAVFSTTYAFRHLRSAGASPSATTWSLAITGLLSALSLSAVGLLGLVLTAGTGGSLLRPVLESALAVSLIVTALRISRRPDILIRWAHRGLLVINRLRRRPAQTGAARLAELTADLRVIRPAARHWAASAALAAANWMLDLACMAACCAAVGVHVGFPTLLITYTAGMAAGSLLPLPAGLGAIEAAMTLGLTAAGAAAAPALAAVVLYRLLSTGSVVIIGWLVVAAQRIHPADSSSTALVRLP